MVCLVRIKENEFIKAWALSRRGLCAVTLAPGGSGRRSIHHAQQQFDPPVARTALFGSVAGQWIGLATPVGR